MTNTGSGAEILWQGRRIIVEDSRAEDICTDASFASYRTAADGAYRALQSTPLFSRSGIPLGAISTFFREPHNWTDRDFRFSDPRTSHLP